MDKQKGQALVEFMLMLSVLLVLVLGLAEVAFMFREYMILQDYTREFGRFAGKGQDFKCDEIGEDSRLLVIAKAMGFAEDGRALRITYITIGNDIGTAAVTRLTTTNLGLVSDAGFDDITTESMVTNHQATLIRNPKAVAITWVVTDVAMWHEPTFFSKPLILKSQATFRVGTIRRFAGE